MKLKLEKDGSEAKMNHSDSTVFHHWEDEAEKSAESLMIYCLIERVSDGAPWNSHVLFSCPHLYQVGLRLRPIAVAKNETETSAHRIPVDLRF
ncbi:hypothetical protein Q1695_009293 [Nippostrongylus brasiliensis]|nr:hypothetical protein Q1695_009293 [Nippostrongylus brasiliensis]